MGSFNVACSISNMSIKWGSKVAYFPLEISRFPNKIGDKKDLLLYQHCFYSPASLPVFGEYDEYGRVENIEIDENVRLLQKKYKVKIDEILENKPEPISSGMFVLRDIYDFLVKNQIDEWGKRIGFFVYNRRKLYREYAKRRKELIEDTFFSRLHGGTFAFREYETFSKTYEHKIIQGKLRKELSDFVLFLCGMGAVNRFFFPAMNGYQCGNKYATKGLLRECLKILKKK